MICKVIDTIEKYGLLSSVKSVAVGVSGGADSMCLLQILSTLKEEYGIVIKAVHINHNLRGEEAKRDENLVKDYCKEKGIELLIFSEDISALAKEKGIGEEECGRIVRYSCFEKANCDAVAVAHSLSDSVETTVYNLLRGTGTKGLCGIPAKRQPNIIRPLISCTRQEIEHYCEKENVPYVTDSTNLTDDYTRNYIRHNIIPSFEKINCAYDRNIAHTANILREENDYIEQSAYKLIKEAENAGGYSVALFLSSHIAVRKRAVHILLSDKMSKPPLFKHIELVNNIIENREGQTEIAKNLYVCIKNNNITFEAKVLAVRPWQSSFENGIAKTEYGTYRLIFDGLTPEDKDIIDFDRIKGSLTLTSRREGDTFNLKSRAVSKSLKKLFNELKIPLSQRGKTAVLRDDENIVWVEGIGVNGPYIPNKDTERIFVVKKEG